MSTENRSSNTEMVRVPRALVHVAVNGYVQEQGHALNELRELLLNTPLEGATHRYPGETNRSRQWRRQVGGVWCESLNGEWAPLDDAMVERYVPIEGVSQSDPVALAVPEECPHIIVFDDADRANEHFCGAGARTAALRRYEQISQSWNAHLFVRISRNSRDDGYSSAAVAEPAEVERLREELDLIKISFDRNFDAAQEAKEERDTLRAQLAELVSAVRSINYGPTHAVQVPNDDEPCYPQRKEWIEWLFGLCDSASAEPSAPIWPRQSCQLEQPTDRPCDACSGKTELIPVKS